jgi:iron complex outermembrane recepter protein
MQNHLLRRRDRRARTLLITSGSIAALMLATAVAGAAHAADADADATAPTTTSAPTGVAAGAAGSEIQGLVVTAESNRVTSEAPAKGSLDETQPQSLITSKFIQQLTPEDGGWTTVVSIAPSIAGGISSNGGIGDYQTITLRGFQDGFFNITWDGIAFGDTNNPTHHSADYFPTSTVGAVVVDRGPGAAGDLGQANFGGAIHMFSPDVSDQFGLTQKLTGESFGTWGAVTTINTGTLSQLGGGKLLLNFDERGSDGELSDAGGHQYNQLAKLEIPIGDKSSLTLFANMEYNYFNFEDSSGPGETWAQTEALGKNFSMNDDPDSEHFIGFNYELKRTDFEYADYKDQLDPSLSLEDQAYTYHYANKTVSTNDLTGFTGPNVNGTPAVNGAAASANTSAPYAIGNASQIGGYDKLNEYRVIGDILRFNQDWSFGTLKVGGLVEGSRTFRANCLVDLSLGLTVTDPRYATAPYGIPPNASPNCKTLEESSWLQWQAFADFYWRPLTNLTITPGFKWVDFRRDIDAAAESVSGEPSKISGVKLKTVPLVGSNTYTSPLYFLTANYKVLPDWAVYAQYATSFLIPELSDLYVTGIDLNTVKPQYTTNYQLGTVYTKGNFTADADIYLIKATNLQIACNVPDGNGSQTEASFCNTGNARYDGIEGETAYAFPFGLTLFANGALNEATQLATPADPSNGIANALPEEELPGAPRWTAAMGGIYDHDHWRGSLTFRDVGTSVQYNPTGAPAATTGGVLPQYTFHLPQYWSLDASAGYDFGHFAIKLQAFNLTDNRTLISFAPAANSQTLYSTNGMAGTGLDQGIYAFEGGRRIELTVSGKF